MRQRYWKPTPDGGNSSGRLVWRDRTQAAGVGGGEGRRGKGAEGGLRVGGRGTRSVWGYTKESRIIESIPFTFSSTIYSIRFCLVIDLFKWYVYEKGKLASLCLLCKGCAQRQNNYSNHHRGGAVEEVGQRGTLSKFVFSSVRSNDGTPCWRIFMLSCDNLVEP